MVQNTSLGLSARSCSKPTPRRASPPGRMASTTTSAVEVNSLKVATSSLLRRSMTMLRLPRLIWRCMRETPSTMGQVISRM